MSEKFSPESDRRPQKAPTGCLDRRPGPGAGSPRTSIAIFIPAYNAAATLGAVISRIPATTWSRTRHVFIVDDGSQDETRAVADRLGETHERIVTVSLPCNRGYGVAVRNGLELGVGSGADFVVCLHADGQYPPEQIDEFVAYMENHGVDILQGSRHLAGTARRGGMPLYKYVGGKCLVWLENRVFGLRMTDYHSGFLVYRRTALETMSFARLSPSFDFDLEMIAMARATGLRIAECAIPTRYGDERSYLNPVTYGLRVIRVLGRYVLGRYSPGTVSG